MHGRSMAVGHWATMFLLLPALRAQGRSADLAQQDRAFVQRASQSDFDEIKLSQMAADKASDQEVRHFAKRMVTDHAKLEQQMKPIADQMGVQLANSLDPDHQAEYDKLSSLSGKDFDMEYIACIDNDHHVALSDFEGEELTTDNQALEHAVQKGHKIISSDTRKADHLSAKLGLILT